LTRRSSRGVKHRLNPVKPITCRFQANPRLLTPRTDVRTHPHFRFLDL
jgi:hypothetical protein